MCYTNEPMSKSANSWMREELNDRQSNHTGDAFSYHTQFGIVYEW